MADKRLSSALCPSGYSPRPPPLRQLFSLSFSSLSHLLTRDGLSYHYSPTTLGDFQRGRSWRFATIDGQSAVTIPYKICRTDSRYNVVGPFFLSGLVSVILKTHGLYSPTHMNHLLIGTADKKQQFQQLAKQPFLLIDDGPIAAAFPKAKHFDITKHSFNPVRGIDYKRARDFAAAVYTASPQGENTLTVRNGKRALTRMLLDATRLDELPESSKDPGELEALATVDELLLSPVLRQVLCNPTNFSFKGSVVLTLDRAAIGDFDAFILGSLAIQQHKGKIIVPDFGFYGRDFYMSLIRQNRLTAGLEFLSELTPKLQQAVLSIKDKTIYRTTREDAERLIFYTRHTEPRNIFEQSDNEYLTTP